MGSKEDQFPISPLGDMVTITSGRLNSSDATSGGPYPFFTCGKDVLRIDHYEHDREAVLLGGNNANAKFPVFYINGKFTARQRVYVIWSNNTRRLNNRFLYYALDHLAPTFTAAARGTTTLFITLPMLKALPVPVPPQEIQTEIVRTLQSLDDKITLLRETNATLETIAQAIFKSWFVDFDPVRAKAEGRDPEGVPPEVADLFPSEFEESELGAIPKGWGVQSFVDHFDVVRGISYKGSGLTNSTDPEGVPMHNLNSVLEGGGYKYAGLKFYRGDFKEKHQVRAGDLIVANTEQGHKHLLIGFPAIVPFRIGKIGLFSHHLYRVRPLASSPIRSQFAYRLLLTPAVREQVIGCSNGTTVNMLKVDGLTKPRFVCPPSNLIQEFDELALSIQRKQECNVTQAENLAELRDTLLPRLMSGKLRITEHESELCDRI